MNYFTAIVCLTLLMSLQLNVIADVDITAEQPTKTMTPQEVSAKQQEIDKMAKETLERLYKKNPAAKAEVEGAYGYGVFEGHIGNFVLYVAGKGLGVAYDNKTKKPVYMDAIRAGTGPGLGYKSVQAVIIFDNDTVYNQFTTLGLHASASGDAVAKIAGSDMGGSKAASLVPGISMYQLINSGLVLQANWGATEFLKNPDLN